MYKIERIKKPTDPGESFDYITALAQQFRCFIDDCLDEHNQRDNEAELLGKALDAAIKVIEESQLSDYCEMCKATFSRADEQDGCCPTCWDAAASAQRLHPMMSTLINEMRGVR